MSILNSEWSDLQEIRNGNDEPIIAIYEKFRQEFIVWAERKYHLEQEDAVDVFQDAVTSFYRNIAQGKLEKLTSSTKTYLFAIGKNIIRDKLKKNDPLKESDEIRNLKVSHEPEIIEFLYNQERVELVRQMLDTMPEPCNSLLRLFYYFNFSMKAIAEKLHYKNENVAKTQKLRCLNALKDKIRKKFKKDDLL
jgi:RNA polymerase sigma-70 factor (ECF subfamily)